MGATKEGYFTGMLEVWNSNMESAWKWKLLSCFCWTFSADNHSFGGDYDFLVP